jgi:hypothetical protein
MQVPPTGQGFPPYVSTGRTPFFGVVLGLAAGATVATVLAVLYAIAIVYIPYVYVLCLLTMLFGLAVGGTVAGVMHALKVRSASFVLLACFAMGAFAWLLSWPAWILAVLFRAEVPLGPLDVLEPSFFLDALGQIYETGTWSLGSSSPAVSGALLGAFWLAEAGLVVSFSTLAMLVTYAEQEFCEACGSWFTTLPEQARYDRDAADAIRDALAVSGDLSVLASAPPPGPPKPKEPRQWASLRLGFCRTCGETNLVGLDIVAERVGPTGRTERKLVEHMPYVCIRKDQMHWLREGLARAQRSAGVELLRRAEQKQLDGNG